MNNILSRFKKLDVKGQKETLLKLLIKDYIEEGFNKESAEEVAKYAIKDAKKQKVNEELRKNLRVNEGLLVKDYMALGFNEEFAKKVAKNMFEYAEKQKEKKEKKRKSNKLLENLATKMERLGEMTVEMNRRDMNRQKRRRR